MQAFLLAVHIGTIHAVGFLALVFRVTLPFVDHHPLSAHNTLEVEIVLKAVVVLDLSTRPVFCHEISVFAVLAGPVGVIAQTAPNFFLRNFAHSLAVDEGADADVAVDSRTRQAELVI